MIDILESHTSTKIDEEHDRQVHEMLAAFGDNPEAIPSHVRELLEISEQPTLEGEVAFALVGLWALGHVEYVAPNLWEGTSGGWFSGKSN
jgi:hypothetical protein